MSLIYDRVKIIRILPTLLNCFMKRAVTQPQIDPSTKKGFVAEFLMVIIYESWKRSFDSIMAWGLPHYSVRSTAALFIHTFIFS